MEGTWGSGHSLPFFDETKHLIVCGTSSSSGSELHLVHYFSNPSTDRARGFQYWFPAFDRKRPALLL
jgi:hypothetical protein